MFSFATAIRKHTILAAAFTYLRYALTTFCFAASVGCLALWWRSTKYEEVAFVPFFAGNQTLVIKSWEGMVSSSLVGPQTHPSGQQLAPSWGFASQRIVDPVVKFMMIRTSHAIGWSNSYFFFPYWYAFLIFALAGIATLRLGRRFTLRSAIIATTVVAGLLGMAVIL